MNYLKQFWIIFKEFLHKRGSEPDIFPLKPTEDTEPLGRYLLSKGYFSIQNKRVKYSAFMPPPLDLHLSVFKTQGLTEDEIWTLGEEVVKKNQPSRTLYGRGEIILLNIKAVDLELVPDNKPPRHANVIGWPQEKHARMLIAQELAAEAILKLK